VVNLTERMLKTKEVAEILGFSRQTITKMAREGILPAYRIGGDWRFRKEEVDRWLESRKNKGGGNDGGKAGT